MTKKFYGKQERHTGKDPGPYPQLIRLKESTTSEEEANNAVMQVNRLLKEYNLSLLDIDDRQPEEKFRVRKSGRLSFKDAFGNYWKRDLLRTCANTITAGCSDIQGRRM